VPPQFLFGFHCGAVCSLPFDKVSVFPHSPGIDGDLWLQTVLLPAIQRKIAAQL
jgi:hypothetical protein